jgi:hypothetical protein
LKKYEIEKDKVLDMWVIWENLTKNSKQMRFFSKLKKECKEKLKSYDRK